MHKKSDFQWTPEAEEAFRQMKKLIAELPTLTAPRENEELIIYLAAAKEAISRKDPKWKFELEGYDIQNRQNRIKGQHWQILIVERPRRVSGQLMAEPEVLPEPWTLFTDGSSCVDGSGAGLILTNPEGAEFTYAMRLLSMYFTKWIEAKAVATIAGNQVKKFVWDNIVCRFGLPGEIISDNRKQFRDNPFKDWARLDEKSKIIEELPHVLWAHRTMIKSSNGETPFSLTYGTEAVISAEIGMPTLRTAEIGQTKNNEALGINLDLIEERKGASSNTRSKKQEKDEKILQLKSP
ncbi:reverse transcriptase domain-containing protein [Tanacetum coccineum]